MLLAIDVGNTHTVLGVFSGDTLIAYWRLQSNSSRTEDEFGLQVMGLLHQQDISADDVSSMIISSVVPNLSWVFLKVAEKYFGVSALLVHSGSVCDMEINIDDPTSLGADRIANAVGVKKMVGTPAIVVDFGTATTFDIIGPNGSYEGGMIAPGVLTSAGALFDCAAKLPHVELAIPDKVIGKNTRDSMVAGIMYGYIGLVDGIVRRIFNAGYPDVHVVATGGLAKMIAFESETITVVIAELTLYGLFEIALANGCKIDVPA